MAPERVEDLIAIPLERAAREIGEVEDIETRVLTGAVVLKLRSLKVVKTMWKLLKQCASWWAG